MDEGGDKMSVSMTIHDCSACPSMVADRHYAGDPFEVVFDWKCKANHEAIIATLDWNDKTPPIPEWCPLRK